MYTHGIVVEYEYYRVQTISYFNVFVGVLWSPLVVINISINILVNCVLITCRSIFVYLFVIDFHNNIRYNYKNWSYETNGEFPSWTMFWRLVLEWNILTSMGYSHHWVLFIIFFIFSRISDYYFLPVFWSFSIKK